MKNNKPRHRARQTWHIRELERDARMAEERARITGIAIPPSKGRHRKWTLHEVLNSALASYKNAWQSIVGASNSASRHQR